MSDECKGYACPPSTTVDLPECEHGWELGNNTAVCATQQPASAPLAATGVDVVSLGIGATLGLLLGLLGMALLKRARRRERQAIHQAGLQAQREALAEVDAIISRGQRPAAEAVAAKVDHDLRAAGFIQQADGTWLRVPTR